MTTPTTLTLRFTKSGELRLLARGVVVFRTTDRDAARSFVSGWNESAGLPPRRVWISLRAAPGAPSARGLTEI